MSAEPAGGRTDLLGRPLPAPPRYGTDAVADVLVSAASRLRVVAEGAGGFEDRLGLAGRLERAGLPAGPYRNVCVVLVDGLGESLLSRSLGHAPSLRRAAHLGVLDAALPSTTAASLATLGTGEPAGRTGMVGYDVVDPERDVVVNQLSGWDPAVVPERWQPLPTVLERLEGVADPVTVSMGSYEGSALTRAALRGGRFEAARSTLARVTRAVDVLSTRTPNFMYLYWGELDQVGHRHGCGSDRWLEALEDLDSGLRRLAARTGEETLILLTADHGMVDVEPQDRVDYGAMPELVDGVRLTAGEPRMVQLHLEDPADDAARARLVSAWDAAFGDRAWILDRDRLIAEGYFGDGLRAGVRERIGDLIVAARGPLALYDLRRVRPAALEMVGQHGSWTDAEREVPLLALRR